MTHTKRSRFLALVGSVVGVAGLVTVGLAGSASASPTPTPSPTLRVAPLHFRPEAFVIHVSTGTPGGQVVALGPVHGAGTGNLDNGPDVWSLTGPTGTVRVLHSPVGPLVVDRASCTASLDQTVRWALIGQTGADRRSFGFGTATVVERAILPRSPRFGFCLTHATPTFTEEIVLGSGRAVNLPRFRPFPHLSPALLPVS